MSGIRCSRILFQEKNINTNILKILQESSKLDRTGIRLDHFNRPVIRMEFTVDEVDDYSLVMTENLRRRFEAVNELVGRILIEMKGETNDKQGV